MKKQVTPERIDDDNPAWTAAEIKRAKLFSALPPSLQTKLRGRPKAPVTKEAVKLRLDADGSSGAVMNSSWGPNALE